MLGVEKCLHGNEDTRVQLSNINFVRGPKLEGDHFPSGLALMSVKFDVGFYTLVSRLLEWWKYEISR